MSVDSNQQLKGLKHFKKLHLLPNMTTIDIRPSPLCYTGMTGICMQNYGIVCRIVLEETAYTGFQ